MTDIPGLPYDGVTDVVDESGNGKGVALNVWPSDNRVPIADDPTPLDAFILAEAELAYAHTSQRLRVGDGYTPGGDEVAYTSDIDAINIDIGNLEEALFAALNGKANLAGGNAFTGNQAVTGTVSATGFFSPAMAASPTTVNQIQLGEDGNNPGWRLKMGYYYDGAYGGAIDSIKGYTGADLRLNPTGGPVFCGGTLEVVGAITSGGSALATVSQLANYLPLSGGAVTGNLNVAGSTTVTTLNYSNGATVVGWTFASGGQLYHDGDYWNWRRANSVTPLMDLSPTGLHVPNTLTVDGTFYGSPATFLGRQYGVAADCHIYCRTNNGNIAQHFLTYDSAGLNEFLDGQILTNHTLGMTITGVPNIYLKAGATQIATIDSSGINLAAGKTYRINGVPIGSGGSGGLPDADYGDVLVSGGATVMTVQGATGNFVGTGNASFMLATDAVNLLTLGTTSVGYNGGNLRFWGATTQLGSVKGLYDATDGHVVILSIQSEVERARITAAGLKVTGTIAATGAITSGGSTLATVSQLANYLPLTGGVLTGAMGLHFSDGTTTAGKIASTGPWMFQNCSYMMWRTTDSSAIQMMLDTSGLNLKGSLSMGYDGTSFFDGSVLYLRNSTGYGIRMAMSASTNVAYIDNQNLTGFGELHVRGGGDLGGAGLVLEYAAGARATLGPAGTTFLGWVVVPDDAYGAGWDGNFQAPTKNAVYDQMQLKANTSALGTAAARNIAVGTSAPGSPAVNDLWVDTN